ncbi:MAG: hypothetical protein K8Q92_03725, partial [Methylophilales bacterium]|nr:hypothetical protein [Methylophilales bacterium]
MSAHLKKLMLSCRNPFRSKGYALVFVAFLIGLGATALIVGAFSQNTAKIERDISDNQQLAQEKEFLLAYVLGANGGGQRPGDLIRPDVTADSDYNGTAESGCLDVSQINGIPLIGSGINLRCLGRLPWKDLGIAVNSPSENDVDGRMPWYAISGNLVDPTCLTILNPSILNLSYNNAYDCSGASLPYPWLTIRDGRGNILSNRVAAIIFIPGPPLDGQSRPSSPLAGVNQYLDSITIANGCTSNPFVAGTYSNADMDNDFIKGDDARSISSNNPCYNGTYKFNDKLVYITIDELMEEATKRAAAEAQGLLTKYNSAVGRFPYAAPLGSAVNSFNSSGTSTSGMVPVDVTDTCTCSSSTSCSCSFGLFASVTHSRASGGSYTSNSGSCTRSGTSCTCTGAGQCRNVTNSRHFDCTSAGVCSLTGSGLSPRFTYAKSPQNVFVSATSPCIISGSTVYCTGAGSFIIGLNEASWFTSNLWQNFFYYQWTSAA